MYVYIFFLAECYRWIVLLAAQSSLFETVFSIIICSNHNKSLLTEWMIRIYVWIAQWPLTCVPVVTLGPCPDGVIEKKGPTHLMGEQGILGHCEHLTSGWLSQPLSGILTCFKDIHSLSLCENRQPINVHLQEMCKKP